MLLVGIVALLGLAVVFLTIVAMMG